jgi:hypothetical protein
MALIALVGANGSPGVTVTALALTSTWPRPVILAECDPAGGDIRYGYLRQLDMPDDQGLMQVVIAELRAGQGREQMWRDGLINLNPPHTERLLLPGITSPAQAPSLAPLWDQLAAMFAELDYATPGYDVIADCGRLVAPCTPWPLLCRADVVLIVARPTTRSLVSAHAAWQAARAQLRAKGSGERTLALQLIGDGDYSPSEIARRFTDEQGRLHVLEPLPDDDCAASMFCTGGSLYRRQRLLRAAVTTATTLRRAAVAQQALLRPAPHPQEATHA